MVVVLVVFHWFHGLDGVEHLHLDSRFRGIGRWLLIRWNELAIIPTTVQQRLPGIGLGGGEESGWHSKTSLESLSGGESA